MKKLIIAVALAAATVGLSAQGIDEADPPVVKATNKAQSVPITYSPAPVKKTSAAPSGAAKDHYTRDDYERHLRNGDKPAITRNDNRNYRPIKRTTTAPKGAREMPQPITIHNHIPAVSGSVVATSAKNPNMDGVVKFNPNQIPSGSGDYTVSVGSDGSMFMSASGGSNDFPLWLVGLIGLILGIVALVVLARNRGGGNNHIHNYAQPNPTPQPNPAATPANTTPATPAATGGTTTPPPAWAIPVVFVQAHPTGLPPTAAPTTPGV